MNKPFEKLSVRWQVRQEPPGLPSFLAREEPFQYGADLGHVRVGDLPDDLQIHVPVVMSHDVPHAAHFRKGSSGMVCRVAGVRCAAASPMISMRLITASCFCLSARKLVSVVSLTYEPMSRAASKMSRSLPSWSVSIQAHGTGQNVLAGIAVRRFFQGLAQDEVHGATNQFFRLTCHFQQLGGRDWR